MGERPANGTMTAAATGPEKTKQAGSGEGKNRAAGGGGAKLRVLLPGLWELISPRRFLVLLGLLLIVINRSSSFILPLSTRYLIDDVVGKNDAHLLIYIVLAVLGATVVQGATSFSLTQLFSKAAWELITDLRIKVQGHIGRLPVAFYDSNRTGILVSRIMADVEGIRNLLGTGLIEFLGSMLTAVIALVLLLRMNLLLTVLCAAIMAGFSVVLRRVFGALRPIYIERAELYADVTGRLTESLGGVRVVKGYRAEERESAIFAAGVRRLLASIMRSLTATSIMTLFSTTIVGVVGALVMFMGAHRLLHHTWTMGQYVLYSFLLAYLVAPVFQIASIGGQITEAVAGFERTLGVLSEADEESDPRRTVSLLDSALNAPIAFEDVSFSYQAEKPVLQGISFTSHPGTVTALVGPSGAGKSTIISLLCGFHTPTQGAIRLDGIDLSTATLASYRNHLGVVLQESFLFDGSIRENILFSRPNASDEEVFEAARVARVDEFVLRFPEGYETIVGERGVKLSGGQRQRLSIARAVLADPRILILDEATSNLDTESEAMIQEALASLVRGRTTFVIAHRLSTIRRADQILVLEQGRIVERGRHADLLHAGGRYFDLYSKQHSLADNLFLAPGEGEPPPDAGSEPENNWVAPTLAQTLRGVR